MLKDSRCCIPVHWFKRGEEMFAKVWPMEVILSLIFDDPVPRLWQVNEDQEFDVLAWHFLKNFPSLLADHQQYNIPSPVLLNRRYSFIDLGLTI